MNAITRDPETTPRPRVSPDARASPNFIRLPGGRRHTAEFLEGFSAVPRELALVALEEAKQLLATRV
jgi:hypothetical protein